MGKALFKGKKGPSRRRLVLWAALGLAAIAAGFLIDRSPLSGARGADRPLADLGALRLSEVQTNNWNTLRSEDGVAPDWIEIENTGREALPLRGAYLQKDDRVNKLFVLPDITLEAGGFLVVLADETAAGDALCAPFSLLAGGGNTLMLFAPDQTLLDSVELPGLGADAAYCRAEDGSWAMTAQATPGEANRVAAQREDAAGFAAGPVVISEVMTDNRIVFPDEDGACGDYIELHNTSERSVSLAGWWLSDDAARPDMWRLPDVTLPANGYLAVHCTGLNRADDPAHLHAGFSLSPGETVSLTDPTGAMAAMVTLPDMDCGQACSLVDGAWTTGLAPTPNAENTPEAAARLNSLPQAQRAAGVTISEVLALPEDENAVDWIELYNGCASAVDLSGFGLSDRLSRPRRWQFPEGTVVGPGEYITVYCSGEGNIDAGSELLAPFSLSADGGYAVCLSGPDGVVLDALFMPVQYAGISYGRSDSGACGYLKTPTFRAGNGGEALLPPAAGATYSVKGGLFRSGDAFSVTLSAEPGSRVYYTLDCSDPTEASSLYTGAPIAVSGTTILRTRVFRDGHLPSLMDAQSYLFDVENAGDVTYVVSLVSDPEGLFSDETGIMAMGPRAEEKFPYGHYGSGANFWMDWEREAHVELFRDGGETALSQECGLKLHGRNSRAFEVKPMKLIARARYGGDSFDYPLFSQRPYDEYEAFLLRASGEDYLYTFMRDVIFTRLAKGTSVLYQEAEECICYLNGEYYCAMYVRENASPLSIARDEGWIGEEDNLDLVKIGNEVMQGSNDTYAALREWVMTHDATTQEAYEMIDRTVDIDNFIEYVAIEIVVGPPDTVNAKRYRNPGTDGKWRWFLFDLDRGLREDIDGFELMAQGTNGQLFMACMKNPTIRERFLVYLNRALATTLSSRSMVTAAQAQHDKIEPYMPNVRAKFNLSKQRCATRYEALIARMNTRPAKVIDQCKAYLGLTDEEVALRFADALAEIDAWAAETGAAQ